MLQKTLIVTLLGFMTSIGLSGCDKKTVGIPDGGYSVVVETIENHNSLIVQKITIKTKGRGHIVLEENAGYNSSSIGPGVMSDEKYQTVNVTLVATLTYGAPHGQRELVVSKVINASGGGRSYSSAALVVDNAFSLENIKVPADTKGDFTKKYVLLRAESDQRYIELYIAKDLPKR